MRSFPSQPRVLVPNKTLSFGETRTHTRNNALIAHDRWFLDRIATHILAFEGESNVTFFDGTVRRAGRVARRGLQGRRPELRRPGGGCVKPRPALGRRSRNFSEYEAWRRQTPGDAASRPLRITYRKLTT